MKQRWYGGDIGLQVRMFVTMGLLVLVYLGFIAAMFAAGVEASAIFIIAAVMLAAQYFFSDRLVLAAAGARELAPNQLPELHAMVDRLVQAADLPRPKLAIVDSRVPNAFATGRSPSHAAVVVTRGLLDTLERPELEAVLAHELAHVKNRDVMVITIASFFATVAQFALRWGMWGGMGRRRGRDSGGGFILFFVASILVWIISFFLIRALSRYREFAADRGAALLTGSPAALQSALLKISGTMARVPERDLREVEALNAFFIIPAGAKQSIMELFSTHPSIEKRLAYLDKLAQEMEAYRWLIFRTRGVPGPGTPRVFLLTQKTPGGRYAAKMLDAIRDFFNALLGRNMAPRPAISAPIFAINNAVVEQEARLGVTSTGFAALSFRNVESSMFGRLEKEIQDLVRLGAETTGTRIEMVKDKYNYLWLLLYDEDFEDLVATMHLASSTLEEHDFGRTLLAAAFQFDGEEGPFFWLYNFKRGLYYPFAPRPNRTRDQTLEMRLKSLMADYLPLDTDTSRWYPLWDIPGDPLPPEKQLPGGA